MDHPPADKFVQRLFFQTMLGLAAWIAASFWFVILAG